MGGQNHVSAMGMVSTRLFTEHHQPRENVACAHYGKISLVNPHASMEVDGSANTSICTLVQKFNSQKIPLVTVFGVCVCREAPQCGKN